MPDWDFCYGDHVKDDLAEWFEKEAEESPIGWSVTKGIESPRIRTVRGVMVTSGMGLHAAGVLREEENRFTAEVWLPGDPAIGSSKCISKGFFIILDADAKKAIEKLDGIGIWERRQPIESFMNGKIITLDALGYCHAAISREKNNFFDVPTLGRQINPALLEIIQIYDNLLFGQRLQKTKVLPERLPTTLEEEDIKLWGEIIEGEEPPEQDE